MKKKVIVFSIGVFLILNIVAIFHAYKFTHLSTDNQKRTLNPEDLTFSEKIATIIFGISNPKSVNDKQPKSPFGIVLLGNDKKIECWEIKTKNALGTVILFHGYIGKKSDFIDRSEEFVKLGYNVLLVDFLGSGGSDGNVTTVGYFEADQVNECFNYIKAQGESKIILYGHSMGAAAILKSIHDYQLKASAIIIECPFASMYQTVCNRFQSMSLPSFPMAGLLVFWGGTLNGFWAFNNNPANYAKKVFVPTLLLYGEQDLRVKRSEIDEIFNNLSGKKELKKYKFAGHENFLRKYRAEWIQDVQNFLISNTKQ